jgi:hypothetical protein
MILLHRLLFLCAVPSFVCYHLLTRKFFSPPQCLCILIMYEPYSSLLYVDSVLFFSAPLLLTFNFRIPILHHANPIPSFELRLSIYIFSPPVFASYSTVRREIFYFIYFLLHCPFLQKYTLSCAYCFL